MGLHDAGPHSMAGPTDGLAFLARGIAAITLVGFDTGQRLPFYHTMDDTTSNVDFPAASLGMKFAKSVMWNLARHDWHPFSVGRFAPAVGQRPDPFLRRTRTSQA